MDEYAQYQGKFTSYMMAGAISYSTKLSSSSSFGIAISKKTKSGF